MQQLNDWQLIEERIEHRGSKVLDEDSLHGRLTRFCQEQNVRLLDWQQGADRVQARLQWSSGYFIFFAEYLAESFWFEAEDATSKKCLPELQNILQKHDFLSQSSN